MVAVAADGVGGVGLRPFLEEQVIVVAILSHRPAIEELVHHQKSHAVAEVQEFGSDRIVRGANAVYADLLERFETPLPYPERNRRAHCAAVLMQTNALDLEILSVEPETRGRFKFEIANAEWCDIVVKRGVASTDFCDSSVKHRMVQVPELRILDCDILLEIRGFTGGNG